MQKSKCGMQNENHFFILHFDFCGLKSKICDLKSVLGGYFGVPPG
jgi:hypothetical protein